MTHAELLRSVYERQTLRPATLETGCPTKKYVEWLEELSYLVLDGDFLVSMYQERPATNINDINKLKRFSGDAFFPIKL